MKKKGFGVLAVLMLSMLLSVTAFAKGKWKVEEGNRYYYNEDGTKQKGWLTLKKGTYYFLPKTGIMATGPVNTFLGQSDAQVPQLVHFEVSICAILFSTVTAPEGHSLWHFLHPMHPASHACITSFPLSFEAQRTR